jgi:hypothetical protein
MPTATYAPARPTAEERAIGVAWLRHEAAFCRRNAAQMAASADYPREQAETSARIAQALERCATELEARHATA